MTTHKISPRTTARIEHTTRRPAVTETLAEAAPTTWAPRAAEPTQQLKARSGLEAPALKTNDVQSHGGVEAPPGSLGWSAHDGGGARAELVATLREVPALQGWSDDAVAGLAASLPAGLKGETLLTLESTRWLESVGPNGPRNDLAALVEGDPVLSTLSAYSREALVDALAVAGRNSVHAAVLVGRAFKFDALRPSPALKPLSDSDLRQLVGKLPDTLSTQTLMKLEGIRGEESIGAPIQELTDAMNADGYLRDASPALRQQLVDDLVNFENVATHTALLIAARLNDGPVVGGLE